MTYLPEHRIFLVNSSTGLAAVSAVCTHHTDRARAHAMLSSFFFTFTRRA